MTERQSERGNIFFALFGAVALVGVVGAATTSLLRGPVSTVMAVNQKTKADTQMQIASKLAMVRSAQEANNGDCDGDGTIEPLSPDTMAGLTGGGALPAAIGAAQLDPWNTKYGYCAWDLGALSGEPTCPGSRLGGGNNMSYPVMVIISAGPDKVFQTQCNAWADATPSNATTLIDKPAGSDDIILSFTYSEAVEAAGGLWSLMSGDPDTITTDKNVAFSSGVEFSSAGQIGGQATFAQNSRLDLGLGGLFLLPTDNELPDGQCNLVNNGALRLNLTDYAPSTILEMCDHTIGFVALGGAGATVAKIDDLSDAKASTADTALFLGDGAGLNYSSTSGAINNIGIGIGAASNLTGGDGNLVIGNGATLLTANTNSSMVIGHGIVGGGDGTLRLGNLLYGSNIYSSAGSLGIGGVPSAMLDVNGNAEADRFQFDNSTYMGYGSGDIRWFTGGTQQMILEAGGNLGIGVADPNAALDVNGDAEIDGDVFADRFIANNSGSAASPSFTFGSASGLGLYAGADYLGFGVGGVSEMTLDDDALTVNGDGLFDGFARASSFQFTSGQGLYPNGGGLTLNTGGSPQFYLDAFGNVGVGEAAPSTALDVSGAVKIGYVPDVNCDLSRAGSIRYASGDALQVCSSITGNFETIGTSGGGGGGSGSYWTRISAVDPRLHYTAGFVGVGINDPQASLHAYGNFLNTGIFGAGAVTPVSGAGTRMMFVPNKAAFRAGAVSATQWNHANIGNYSAAFGNNTVASGENSFAAGSDSYANGVNSFATGRYAAAIGDRSIVLGNEVRVTGTQSMALGLGAPSIAPPPAVSGGNSFGIFMGDQSGVDITTNNLMALLGGRFIIDPDASSATNIIPSGLLTLDVHGDIGAIQYCDEDGANCFTAGDISGGGVGIWEDASNVIRLTSGTVNYSSASFVFGSPSLNSTGVPGENTRMIFDKVKGAFRAGIASGAEWDNANLGNRSVAFGVNSIASGDNSFAVGTSATASGYGSTAIGTTANAIGSESFALGLGTRAEGNYAVAAGQDVRVTGANAYGLGLGGAAGTDPIVSGASSFGIFMGDQSSVNFSSSRTMGLFGGGFIIDPALPATNFATSGTLALDVQGQIGAIEYCDEDGLNCFDADSIGSAYGADGTIQFASGGKFWSSPTFLFSSASGGRIGVGTATPSQALHVVGSVRATQSLILDAVAGNAPASMRLVDLGDTTITAATGGDILKYDSATSRWINAPSSSVTVSAAGADRQVQFNDAGAFGALSTFVFSSAGRLGLGTASPVVTLDINATDAILMPRGVDGQRPSSPVNGMIRYNSTTNKFEGYQNGSWQDILTGAATSAFLSLTDTPASYAGTAGQYVRVNAGANSLEFTDQIVGTVSGQPAPNFISLDDLSNVDMSIAPTAGQSLVYDSAASRWKAGTGSGAPGGATTQVQFNSAGAFGGSTNFIWDNATNALSVTGKINVSDRISIAGTAGAAAPVGLALSNLSDIDLSVAPTGGQSLVYDSAASRWKAGTGSSGGGTPAGADRQMQFNSSGAFGASSTLVYSSVGFLGVGTANPTSEIDLRNGSGTTPRFRMGGGSVVLPNLTGSSTLNSVSGSNVFMQFQQHIGATSSTFDKGGSILYGLTANATNDWVPLHLIGQHGGTAPTVAAVVIAGQKHNGTNNRAELTGTEPILDVVNMYDSGSSILALRVLTNGDVSNAGNMVIGGTGSLTMPRGSDGDRPVSPVNGMIRYSSTSNKFEGYQNGSWQDILTGAATSTFLSQTDTPSSYATANGQFVRVNAGSTALEFTDNVIGSVTGQPLPSFISLDDLSDVNLSVAPTTGQVLSYNGTTWVAAAAGGGGGGGTIDDLTDAISNTTSTVFLGTGSGTITTGINTTGVGINSLAANTTGAHNTAVGMLALATNISGEYNTAVGSQAGRYVRGGYNTAVGESAMVGTSGTPLTGSYNSAFGTNSLFAIRGTAASNTALGENALMYLSTGSTNTAVGTNAMQGTSGNLLTGTDNTAIGKDALLDIRTTAANNVAIGAGAGSTTRTGSNNILIGRNVIAPANNTSNYLNIGGALYGDMSGGSYTVNGSLHVLTNISYVGTLTDTSDMRLKTDIHPLRNRGSMLEKIGAIDTYSFRMKDEATRQIEFGVMAQELEKIFPELVKVDQSSPEKYMSVNYIGLITPLISATQELKAENDNLKAQLDTLETRLASMETDMQGMKVHTGYGIGRAEIGLWMVAGMGGFMIVFFFGGALRRRLQKMN